MFQNIIFAFFVNAQTLKREGFALVGNTEAMLTKENGSLSLEIQKTLARGHVSNIRIYVLVFGGYLPLNIWPH